ncbi:hypothetical protein GBAR_LOCUS11514 [Geodia barretti]|uniref:Uncharacterized protein n=1 Tax=Geodia barretti TaxID=519541 RepID=A0AA35RZI5_GEOBA|nr:hypothetical protein GBAR_LOCUS11514 [Geodia barretti]
MSEAPAVDETLESDDVTEILDELVEAQNHSYVLGLKLLPQYEVEAIHCRYQDPLDRLLHILFVFTRQIQPRPTWRVIVEALRSPSVNLPALAARVEAVHFLDSTATRDVVPKTTGAPEIDEMFKSDDVSDILYELVEAQNHSYVLGLKLLPQHEVEAIHRQYQDPKERLLHILLFFTRQIQPRPTWRVIVEALRSHSVNLPRLAARVEAAHFPDSTATRDVVPETTTESAVNTTAADEDEVKPKPFSHLNPANSKNNYTLVNPRRARMRSEGRRLFWHYRL